MTRRRFCMALLVALLALLGPVAPSVVVQAQSDLFTRRTLTLSGTTPDVTGTITLDAQTEWIEVAIDRPTTGSSGITWASGTQIGVSIQVLLDGQVREAQGRSSGGIRISKGAEMPTYALRWQLPSGYFGGATGKRLCETRQNTCQVRIRFELLRGVNFTSSVVVRSASSALSLPERHNSVAYDTASSTQEQSGDGVLSFSHTATGSNLAAFAYSGNGVASPQAGATTYNGVSMTELWDEVFQTSYRHAGYSLAGIPSGASTVTNTLGGSPSAHIFGVITMTGVDQSTPVGTPQTANGTTAAPSVTVSDDGVGDMVVAGVTSIDNDFESALGAVGANQDERWRVNTATDSLYGAASTQAGNLGGVMSWADSTATQWGIGAVTFNQVPPTVALTGTVTASITESDIVAGGKTIILTATDDTFVDNLSAISYVGGQDNSFAGTTSNTDVNFALTGGSGAAPIVGDLVVVTFCTGSTADRTLSITNTAGTAYTLIGSELYSNDLFDTNMRVAYRFMPNPTETAVRFAGGTGNAQDAGTYAIQVFRNVDTGTPMDVAATTISAANQNTRLINPPGITPATAGAWIGISGCGAGGTLTADYTSPGGAAVTDFRTDGQTDTNDSGVAAWHNTTWTSGEYNPAALTGGGTDTTDDSYASVAWALRPATDNAFDDQRDELRDGCDSAQAEGTGWDALKSTTMPVANVVRTSSTVVTITLAAAASYNITAQETVTCTVPAAILAGGGAVVATPTFTIDTGGGGAPPTCHRSLLGVGCVAPPVIDTRRRRDRP